MDLLSAVSQDQGDSIQVPRVEKWVLLSPGFLFPDKLELKKDNGSVTSPLPVSCSPHSCDNGFFSPSRKLDNFPVLIFNYRVNKVMRKKNYLKILSGERG